MIFPMGLQVIPPSDTAVSLMEIEVDVVFMDIVVEIEMLPS